VHQDIFN